MSLANLQTSQRGGKPQPMARDMRMKNMPQLAGPVIGPPREHLRGTGKELFKTTGKGGPTDDTSVGFNKLRPR